MPFQFHLGAATPTRSIDQESTLLASPRVREIPDLKTALRSSLIVLLIGLAAQQVGSTVYHLVDHTFGWISLTLFALPIALYLLSFIGQRTEPQIQILKTLLRCAGGLLFLIALVCFANGFLDHAPPQSIECPVLRSYETRGRRSHGYHLVVDSWRPGHFEEDLSVSASEYVWAQQKQLVAIEIHGGFFGVPWYGRVTAR